MRLVPIVLLVVVGGFGCRASDMDYPIGGGGGHGGGGTKLIDAAEDGAGSGSDLAATACVLTDPRDLTSCKGTGELGLTVALGSATATTLDDGTFTIARPAGTNLAWEVTGSTVVKSVTPYAAQTRIPVMDSTMLATLQGDNGVQTVAGTGALLIRIVRSGAPVTGETATIVPLNDPYGALYDGASASSWTQSGTGAFGTVYLPDVAAGTATVTLHAAGVAQAMIGAIPISDGGVTFVIAELP
jgi:hypothetical protein